ncbi:MAG: hypothetical protein ACYDAP_01085 [Thermoplasmataceae archaeon]
MEYIIYKAFSRSNNNHPYAYVSSDVLTHKDGARDDAWDLLLVDKAALDSNVFKPVFIEVKSSVSDASATLSEMKSKIDLTNNLLRDKAGIDFIVGQIPEEVENPPDLTIENPEFVIFSPSHYYHSVYRRANMVEEHSDPNSIPLILWSFENSSASSHCISIPYIDENNVKKCKNILTNGNKFVVCKHDNDNLNSWLRSCAEQNLGASGGVMPSGNGFTDIAVNIVALLTTGRVFNSSTLKLGKTDVSNKIRTFFTTYRIFVSDQFIKRIIETMEACQIIMPNYDPMHTFSLNNTVSEKSKRADYLIEDIVKRLVKNNFGSPSETLEGSKD